MEQIRRRARAGLMAAPRVGMAVGGLLLGLREISEDGPRTRILDSIDLPCSHSTGPSFTLTPDEKNESREMVAEANALSAASKVSVVGWYCSKTRGEAVLSDSDLSFFAELLPGAGKIALVLRPDIFEAMRAVFHFRTEDGAVVKGLECEVDEWRPVEAPPAPATEAVAGPVAAPPESPKVIEIRQPAAKPPEPKPAPAMSAETIPAETRLEDVIGLSANAAPAPAQTMRSPIFGQPDLPLAPPPRRSSKLVPILAAAGFLIALALAAFFTRDSWLPRPPLTLSVSENNGTLMIHWDPDSVRGIAHASMYVNDGGQPKPTLIPLDRLELNQGLFSYTPKSKRVTAKLDTGRSSAFSSWFAPEPKAPPADASAAASAPATSDPAPADAAPKPAP